MPSKGNNLHEYLKKEASKKVFDIYGQRLDFLRHEQVQSPDGQNEQNYFKTKVSLGSPWHDQIEEEVLNYPDILVQINLTELERNVLRKKRGSERFTPYKKIIIIECETGRSPLVSGKSEPRYHAYKIIKDKHKDEVLFILATFENINVSTDLFDDVWKFKRP